MGRRNRIKEAIAIYESIIVEALKAKKRIFFISLVSPISLVISTGISIFYSNLGAVITSLGLGGANFAILYATIGNTIDSYLKESSSLKQSVKKLKLNFVLCGSDDYDRMDDVERDLKKNLEELEKAERSL